MSNVRPIMNGKAQRPIGLLLLVLSIFMIYHSIQTLNGQIPFPQECHYKKLFCELENMLFEQGGDFSVGMIRLAFSLFLFVIGYIMATVKPNPTVKRDAP
jgi:hypothetical protein